jgi:hypothetical protein
LAGWKIPIFLKPAESLACLGWTNTNFWQLLEWENSFNQVADIFGLVL